MIFKIELSHHIEYWHQIRNSIYSKYILNYYKGISDVYIYVYVFSELVDRFKTTQEFDECPTTFILVHRA